MHSSTSSASCGTINPSNTNCLYNSGWIFSIVAILCAVWATRSFNSTFKAKYFSFSKLNRIRYSLLLLWIISLYILHFISKWKKERLDWDTISPVSQITTLRFGGWLESIIYTTRVAGSSTVCIGVTPATAHAIAVSGEYLVWHVDALNRKTSSQLARLVLFKSWNLKIFVHFSAYFC